jgi:hypothetical protein
MSAYKQRANERISLARQAKFETVVESSGYGPLPCLANPISAPGHYSSSLSAAPPDTLDSKASNSLIVWDASA